MFRSNTYNEGSFYSLTLLSRQAVVPGQSVAIDLQAIWETAAFSRNVLNGGMASVFAFYVPYRLVWDEWTDFVSDPQSPATVPLSAVQFPMLFERAPVQNTFGRRAYKLVYNQYFGSDQFGADTFYADITNDADVSIKGVRTVDQFVGSLMPSSEAPDETYAAPVTGTVTSGTINPGTVATLSLNEFRLAMKQARSSRRSDLTGDKYVDAMRRMGVALDWKIQNAPEFLGSSSIDFAAKETRATFTSAEPVPAGSAQTGRAYARFNEAQALKTPRKFFAEHGLVLTMLVVRPFTFSSTFVGPQDVFQNTRDDFFLGDNQTGVSPATKGSMGATTGEDWYQSRFSWLRKGQNMVGRTSANPWFVDQLGTDIQLLAWPNVVIPQDAALGNDFAVYTRYKAMGPSPVKSISF